MSEFVRLTSGNAPFESTPAVTTRPKRGPCLARRTGQSGNVYQPAHPGKWAPKAPCYGRLWVDVPGSPERQRRTVSLGVCATKTVARQRLREYIQQQGINTADAFHRNTAPATTFGEQAKKWLADIRKIGRASCRERV